MYFPYCSDFNSLQRTNQHLIIVQWEFNYSLFFVLLQYLLFMYFLSLSLLCSRGCLATCVGQAGLKHIQVHLPLPPECQDQRYVLSCIVCIFYSQIFTVDMYTGRQRFIRYFDLLLRNSENKLLPKCPRYAVLLHAILHHLCVDLSRTPDKLPSVVPINLRIPPSIQPYNLDIPPLILVNNEIAPWLLKAGKNKLSKSEFL